MIAMIENAKAKRTYLEYLLEHTKTQAKAISEKNMEKMDMLYQKKGEIIQIIDRLDGAFLEQFETLKEETGISKLEELNVKQYPELAFLQKVVFKLTELSQRICDQEEKNRLDLARHISEIKMKLKQGRDTRRATSAYTKQQTTDGNLFIDHKK